MPNSDLFGYERRQQALKSARKIDNRHAMKVSQRNLRKWNGTTF